MKLVTYLNAENKPRAGFQVEDKIYDLEQGGSSLELALPVCLLALIEQGEKGLANARQVEAAAKEGKLEAAGNRADITLLSPLPRPASCRDAYAFRQHVASARRNRGVDMIPEFDQFPIFYLTNHLASFGEGDITLEKDHFLRLDFELEVAIVVGKGGKNIPAEKADEHIYGYMIMNDFSARQMQMEEMKLNLGPCKGKDFANTFGPWLVTPDELESKKVTTEGSVGNQYDLVMKAFHNGEQVSEGNMSTMTYTFAEILERCSYGIDMVPGEVIGSGTVGTGCYLELNGTWRREAEEKGEEFTPKWLQPGDEIVLEIDGLGRLANKLVLNDPEYSILAKKKNV